MTPEQRTESTKRLSELLKRGYGESIAADVLMTQDSYIRSLETSYKAITRLFWLAMALTVGCMVINGFIKHNLYNQIAEVKDQSFKFCISAAPGQDEFCKKEVEKL